jgi:hypothetical protein
MYPGGDGADAQYMTDGSSTEDNYTGDNYGDSPVADAYA